MSQAKEINRRITLASRPVGAPLESDFSITESARPQAGPGEMLLRTVYLSLDPYMRGRMSDAKSYAPPLEVGDVMVGGTVSLVEESNHPDFKPGDWVLSFNGWQDYCVSNGEGIRSLGRSLANPSYAVGIMGMPGFTGYMGLLEIGKPVAGETIVVAAATGPVGSTVGQIGKIKECRVVGVAGGPEKCKHATEKLGLDACIDHSADDFVEQLRAACPDGVDIYFENVGGKVLDAVLPLLNMSARIPVCGLISQYNATALPEGPDRLDLLMRMVLTRRLTIRGFIITQDFAHGFKQFSNAMQAWLEQGKIHYREHRVDGLENAVTAFQGLLEGKNFGKLVVQVGQHD